MSNYIQSAFKQICNQAKSTECWYVCLIETYSGYGGPEEGGWWYDVDELVAYQEFPTEKLASKARENIEVLARELTAAERVGYGETCLQQMEWLEARGLDSDFLPENDGPSEYKVWVCDELPKFSNVRPHYE